MKFIATGRVLPERVNAWLRDEITWSIPQLGTLKARVEASQITVVGDCPGINDYTTGLILAEQMAGTIIASLGFQLAAGYSVEMSQLIEENGDIHVFGVQLPNLVLPEGALVNAERLARKDVCFRFALFDYCRATNSVLDCPHFCYRSLESLTMRYRAPGKKPAQAWEDMRNDLGRVTREVIQDTIEVFADPIRHGNWAELQTKPTTSDQRNAMVKLTRDILVAYLNRFGEPV